MPHIFIYMYKKRISETACPNQTAVILIPKKPFYFKTA